MRYVACKRVEKGLKSNLDYFCSIFLSKFDLFKNFNRLFLIWYYIKRKM